MHVYPCEPAELPCCTRCVLLPMPLPLPSGAHQPLQATWPAALQVLWPKDAFLGGSRGCQDGQDSRLLRSLVHAQYGIPLPAPGTPPPRVITLQRKSSNRRLLNEGEVVQMLAEFGEVRGQPSQPAGCGPGGAVGLLVDGSWISRLAPRHTATPTPAGASCRVWR